MNEVTRLLRNTSVLVVGRILGSGLAFASSIVVVRSLGSDGYGQYSLIYAFPAMFAWLAEFGTSNIITRKMSQSPENASKIWSTNLILSVILSGLALIAMYVTSILVGYNKEMFYLFSLSAIELILFIPWRSVDCVFQAKLQQWRSVVATLIRQSLWLLVLLLITKQSSSLMHLVVIRTGIAAIEIILFLVFVRPLIGFQFSFSISLTLDILKKAWPLALSLLSISIYHRIDRVLIERFLTAKDLGLYATADNLIGLMSIVPTAFMMSAYPLLCRQMDNINNFEFIAITSFRWLLIIQTALAGIFVLLGKSLIVLVYGVEFSFSANILHVLAIAQIAVCYGVVISQILVAQDLQFYITISTVSGAIINLLGNLWLLPSYGVIGAAWVTVFSYFLTSVGMYLLFPATRCYTTRGIFILFKILTIGAIALFIVAYLIIPDIIATLLFLSIFSFGIMILGLINHQDINLLKNALFFPKILKLRRI